MFSKLLKKLKIKKLTQKDVGFAIVRNHVNKAFNKALLLSLFGKKLESSLLPYPYT